MYTPDAQPVNDLEHNSEITGELSTGQSVERAEATQADELVFNVDRFRVSPGGEMTGEQKQELNELVGKLLQRSSNERTAKENEEAQNAYAEVLSENLVDAGKIEAEMTAEKAAIVEKYGDDQNNWPKDVRQAANSHNLGWGFFGIAAGASVIGGFMPSNAEAGMLEDFGKQVEQGIRGGVVGAGTDSGGVVGGAARIIIDRAVNNIVKRGVEATGAPTAQTPEEVVVVPRSIGGGVGVYGQGNPGYGAVRNGEVRYGGGDQGTQIQERNLAWDYARRLDDINSRWTPAQIEALKTQHTAEVLRQNNYYKEQLLRATNEDQKAQVYADWAAAKAAFNASWEKRGPWGEKAQLDNWARGRGLDIQRAVEQRQMRGWERSGW